MKKEKNKIVRDAAEIWRRYEKSKDYMTKKNLKERTERSWKFYIGKQWYDTRDSKGEKNLPSMNFIKPSIKYKVSSISQHLLTAIYSDLDGTDEETCNALSQLFSISWEKAKMESISWKALKHCAIGGDTYVYFYSGDTRKKPQVLLNTNILLGDENTSDIQEQPYIIIEERMSVEQLRHEAKLNGASQEVIDGIVPNSNTDTQLLNDDEVSDKATALIYFEKIDGIVNVARATKSAVYEPLHPIQQSRHGEYTGAGLTQYPILNMVWEEFPNTARGVGEVEQLLSNQLEANKMLARRAISSKQTSFPRVAYDETAVANPEEIDTVGGKIKLNGGQTQPVSSLITYLNPASQSPDAKELTDELIDKTRDLSGAGDVMMGNYNPSRVAGTAITTIREQQELPLNEQVEMYQNFVEDVALLWYELWIVYNPVSIKMGNVEVNTSVLQEQKPSIKIDITENTTLSKAAEQTEITNLLMNDKISFEEYVELLPDQATISKKKLLSIIQKRKLQQEQMAAQMAQNPTQPDAGTLNEQPINSSGGVPEGVS